MPGKILSFIILIFLGVLLISASFPLTPYLSVESIFVAASNDPPVLVQSKSGRVAEPLNPGSTVYFPIINASRAQDLEGWRVIIDDWIAGQKLVRDTRIEYIEVFDSDKITSLGYTYAAAVTLAKEYEIDGGVINARIAVTQKRYDAKWTDFSLAVRAHDVAIPIDSITCIKKNMPLSFSATTSSISILFGNRARFDVDLHNQSDVNVGFSSEPFTDIVISYPEANLSFYSWNKKPVFNRVGRLYLYADADSHLYELEKGMLKLLAADYYPEENAYVITTRRLGYYIISDRLLSDPYPLSSRINPPTYVA